MHRPRVQNGALNTATNAQVDRLSWLKVREIPRPNQENPTELVTVSINQKTTWFWFRGSEVLAEFTLNS